MNPRSEPNAASSPPRETTDQDNGDESGDEKVLDELAVKPTPHKVEASDVPIDDTVPPDELLGRATSTAESLTSLFESNAQRHLTDGFVGSGDEDGNSVSQNDGDDTPDGPDHPAGA
jgi:hypothetical protein